MRSQQNSTRRRFLQATGGTSIVALSGCLGDEGDEEAPSGDEEAPSGDEEAPSDDEETPDEVDELMELHTSTSEASATIPVYFQGMDEGAWEEHGVDLSLEVMPFGQFARAVLDDLVPVGANSLPPTVEFINRGEDLTILGAQITLPSSMFTRTDSPIEDVEDLADYTLGLPPATSTTAVAHRAIIRQEFGFDIFNDPDEVVHQDVATLPGLLDQGEVDAASYFTGGTLRAFADDDQRAIFQPDVVWEEQHGHPLSGVNFITKNSFIENEENAELTLRFLEGYQTAAERTRENSEEAIQNYGLLAGMETEEEANVLREWIEEENKVIGPYPFTEELAENEHQIHQTFYEYGDAWDEVPSIDEAMTTTEELEELAGR